MLLARIATAAAASALLAGAATAQTTGQSPATQASPHSNMDHSKAGTMPMPQGAHSAGTTATVSPDARPGREPNTAAQADATASGSAALGAEQAGANASASLGASAGGTQLVTNGPVADTPENRRMYRPLSNAGRRSAARGN